MFPNLCYSHYLPFLSRINFQASLYPSWRCYWDRQQFPAPNADSQSFLLKKKNYLFFKIFQIEVHAFLFTDMLLVTKPVKRLGESRVKFKIIRQPFVIDRLVTLEVARDPPTLACVYLSIYQTACSAFVLSCSEMELIKVSHC